MVRGAGQISEVKAGVILDCRERSIDLFLCNCPLLEVNGVIYPGIGFSAQEARQLADTLNRLAYLLEVAQTTRAG